jgi:2-polyprenyl-3-methyl-5-hydroxy-6-metoxy-1,4-benzoquinol methylase
MITISECPVCKGNTFTAQASCIDHTVSHETFQVIKCSHCSLAITSPRPEDEQLDKYYQSVNYISHSGKSSGGIGIIYRMARSFSLIWKKNLIHRFKKSGDILDFGCGTGEFLYTLQKSGWKTTGVEPSNTAREKAKESTQHTIAKNLDEISNQSFDVITAWHVLEHVPDLTDTLHKLKAMIRKNGMIIIAVPNYESYDGLVYKNHWAGYDVPRHLWHFSKKSMNQLLANQGFTLVSIVPMKLDSYYISLLSEKYTHQNRQTVPALITAFANGFISNLKARRTTNHSSLIYIAKVHEE